MSSASSDLDDDQAVSQVPPQPERVATASRTSRKRLGAVEFGDRVTLDYAPGIRLWTPQRAPACIGATRASSPVDGATAASGAGRRLAGGDLWPGRTPAEAVIRYSAPASDRDHDEDWSHGLRSASTCSYVPAPRDDRLGADRGMASARLAPSSGAPVDV